MVKLLGYEVVEARRPQLLERIKKFHHLAQRPPCLAVVLVGDDPSSQVYVTYKIKACAEAGVKSLEYRLPSSVAEDQLLAQIQVLNQNSEVDGILVQFPLPAGLSKRRVLETLVPTKDVDGLTPLNMGRLWSGVSDFAPCTPQGIMALFEHYGIPLEGREALVVGRSEIVGRPMAFLLSQANATVTICHSKTRELREHTQKADIVVVAAGREGLLRGEDFKEGAVVIDVGIHRPRTPKKKLRGDVHFKSTFPKVSAITPVPAGVGPLTIQMLMENTVTLAERRLLNK